MLWQKESLGEYGSGWGWDNTGTLAFNQETIVIDKSNSKISYVSPIRYIDSGTKQSTCPEEITQSSGEILFSGSNMSNQTSCSPNTGNSGNWYTWPAATSGGSKSSGAEENSICPRGWQLTVNTENEIKSWSYLITKTYSISTSGFNDSSIRYLPMSFIRSGRYDLGSLSIRGSDGAYWSAVASTSTSAHFLGFVSGNLSPRSYSNKYLGFAVRCVVR